MILNKVKNGLRAVFFISAVDICVHRADIKLNRRRAQMKFAVYQIQLTDDQIDTINAKGHDSVPAQKAKLDMTMDFGGERIGGLAVDAFEAGYYSHVANIAASTLNEVFEIGNIGPRENIQRLARMSSLSVGDLIVDEEGDTFVIAPVGFIGIGVNKSLAA